MADYTELVKRINKRWHRGMTKEEAQKAVDEAVASCIRDGILVDFLTKHRAEVVDVCLTEFDEKAYAETLLEDGRKMGLEEGKREGIEEGIKEGAVKRDKQLVEQMLRDGKSPDEIHDFCHISMELIESVREEMLSQK